MPSRLPLCGMADGNKPAKKVAGRDLEREILRIGEEFPDNVYIGSMPMSELPLVLDVLTSRADSEQGRRHAIDPISYPVKRAQAVNELRRLGVYPSQKAIAGRLKVGERTIRNYDNALRRAELRDAPEE